MDFQTVMMGAKKTIALVAHDHKKPDLLAWAKFNLHLLAQHRLMATGTTGTLLETELQLPVFVCRAARWEEINRSARRSRRGRSNSSFSFGTLLSHNLTIQM